MGAKDKVILRHASLALALDKTGTFGNTTLTAAAVAGATTLAVAGISNFGVSEWIRVGSGETLEFIQISTGTAPSGGTITLQTALRKNHALGEAVVEQTPYDLGPVLNDRGVIIRYAGASQTINVASSRLAHAILNGFVDGTAEFDFPNVSLSSFAFAVGALRALLAGSGTVAQPTQVASDGTDFAGASNMTLIVSGKLFDGTDLTAYLYGVDADYTGVSLKLTRGAKTPMPVKYISAGGGAFDTSVPALAADTTNTPTKAQVFDALVAAGVFEDAGSPAATTVSANGGVGTNSFTLTSGTGLAVGDWMRFGVGNLMEIWQLDTINTGTGIGTIRGLFIRTQTGKQAAKQTLTLFDGVDQDGATLALGGTVEIMHSALSRTSIGARPGNVDATFSIPVIGTTLANIARTLAIPQASVSGGRLLTDGGSIGSGAEINGMYLRGTLVGGTNWAAIGSGISIDLSQATEVPFNNVGKPNTLLLAGKPSGGLALLNY